MRISRKQPLAIWRAFAGMSQEDLAKAVGVSRRSVSNWETGFKMPRPRHIAKIEEVLNIDYYDDVVVPRK